MKLQPKGFDEEIEIDMSPMIDMVFLLLIFFIVASQIIDEKPRVKVPAASAAKIPDNSARLMISVTKDDDFYFRLQKVPFEELTVKIQQEFEADPSLRILIRADGEVKYETTEKIMMACAEIGAVDIIFAATEE